MNDMNTNTGSNSFLPDEEIRTILTDRIDVRRQNMGIVVGVIDGDGRRVIAHGKNSAENRQTPDDDSVFEIGSITKVFTKLLLADMALRGEVSIDDPVENYLPDTVKVPERNGRKITLFDLAAHASGLPRVPDNLQSIYTGNPYTGYTVERLYEFLSGYELTREIGSEREYSNLGVGLLGHALTGRAGTDYDSLIRSRICEPLGMYNTGVTFTPEMKKHLAPGHDAGLTPIDTWDFPALEGCGALRSTANDLLLFVAAHLGLAETPLAQAIRFAQTERRVPAGGGMDVSLGWGIITGDDKEIYLHHGGTGGYCSSLGYDTRSSKGAVILSNTGWQVADIFMYLIDANAPLAEPPRERTAVKVDTGLYDRYTGKYRLDPEFAMSVSREGDRLFTEATGLAKYELFPENEHDFFYKVMDTQISFVTGEDGYASELLLRQYGDSDPLKRVE
ncbi:MAG: serine hydrolase [Dehalococcoidales bacterium]|nr:serine hydrolase [Dehalococcoidales bacterium]